MIVSHRRPDGDALGSIVGMVSALRARGAEPMAMLYAPLPSKYRFLESESFDWYVWAQTREVASEQCDGVIVVDTCALAQLEPVAEFLCRAPRTLVIDHHATRDPIGMREGDLRYFDETAAATALIVTEWMKASGHTIDAFTAQALFTGIATDTGWFRFSNTDVRALRTAADLVEVGAVPNWVYEAIYQNEPPEKLKLIAHVLNNLELYAGGRLAVMRLRQADFERTGTDETMTEDLVNEAARLHGTEVTLLITEEPGGVIRVNFRSRRDVDVASLARRYGGGGHVRAAGARLRGAWEDVVPRLIEDTVALLE